MSDARRRCRVQHPCGQWRRAGRMNMLRQMKDMPVGTIGFEAAGEVEGDAVKADAAFRARHVSSFDRVAVVSDEDWVRPALRALAFMLPGKAKGFRAHDLAEAKAWLAVDSDRNTA